MVIFGTSPKDRVVGLLPNSRTPWLFSMGLYPILKWGCRFVPYTFSETIRSATDGFSGDLNIGDSPGFGGFICRAKSTLSNLLLFHPLVPLIKSQGLNILGAACRSVPWRWPDGNGWLVLVAVLPTGSCDTSWIYICHLGKGRRLFISRCLGNVNYVLEVW